MVDNKSKTSLIRHIQKVYITHEDYQYNTHALHSYNIVIVICDIFFSVYVIREDFRLSALAEFRPPPRNV